MTPLEQTQLSATPGKLVRSYGLELRGWATGVGIRYAVALATLLAGAICFLVSVGIVLSAFFHFLEMRYGRSRYAQQPTDRAASQLKSISTPIKLPTSGAWSMSGCPSFFALNSVSRAIGLRDIYPFIIAPPVIEKLSFIHHLVQSVRTHSEPVGLAGPLRRKKANNGLAFT